ncbi:hypothetical protein [Domibacillus tundrae]|uniref:hypothetical protein n=1 Tax=Domibacillus tundrae TaxID=1587527 RepID=UPI0006180E2D|nr:hypothetical protein [Domibacillus tundrae]
MAKTIHQQIEEERKRVNLLRETSANQDALDDDKLKGLQEDYRLALIKGDDQRLDTINEQIKEVSVRTARRKEQIALLANEQNNPVIRRCYLQQMEQYETNAALYKQQAVDLAKKLEDQRRELLKGMQELVKLHRNYCNQNSVYNDAARRIGMPGTLNAGFETGILIDNLLIHKVPE